MNNSSIFHEYTNKSFKNNCLTISELKKVAEGMGLKDNLLHPRLLLSNHFTKSSARQ